VYNYLDAYVFMIDETPESKFTAGSVDDADCKYLGVCKSDSGFKLSQEETVKDSASNDIVLSYKLEINVEALTALTDAQKAQIDGVTASLLFLPTSGVTIPSGAAPLTTTLATSGVVLPATPSGTMLRPCVLKIEEDQKYGSGKVSAIVIKGEKIAQTKAELRKTATIVDTV